MDIFDIRRRDLPSLDKYLDIKSKPFGGPNETAKYKGNKRKSLSKYQRNINRDRAFEGNLTNPSTGEAMYQPNYDSYWAAIEQDRPSRDSNKKTQEIMYAKPTYFTKVEEGNVMRFDTFVNENMNVEDQDFDPNVSNFNELETDVELGYEVDEEQLEQVLEEYGDDINELIDKITDDLELENNEVCDLLCAVIEKLCNSDEDLEDLEQDNDDVDDVEKDDDQDNSNLEAFEHYTQNRRYKKSSRVSR